MPTNLEFGSRPRLAAVLLVLAVMLGYGWSLRAPFLFDDTGAVVKNPTIRQLWPLSVPLSPPPDGSTTTGRPVVNYSFALNYALSGDRVWSYHVANVAIHAVAALCLLGLVRRVLRIPRFAERYGAAAPVLAFLAALLWAVHPLQTESVIYVSQRTESLCGLFYLLTLYCFLRGATEDRLGHRWLLCSVGCCLIGMGSKEVMVTAPVVVLCFDRTFLAGGFAAAWRQRRGFYLALAATWILAGWLVWRAGGARGVAAGFGLGVSSWSYLLKQCEALVLYLRLVVWPHPLVVDYGTAVVSSVAEVWWQGVVVVALLAATVGAFLRRTAAGFVGASCFLVLSPSSSVIPLVTQTMAEHRMYLPLAGLVVLAAGSAYRWCGPRAFWLLGAVAIVFGALTIHRNFDYRDAITIWTDNTLNYPRSARAHNNLALAWQDRGDWQQANAHYARAIALQPDYVSAHYNWGVALLAQNRMADAIAQLSIAVQLAPAHADARVNLGDALVRVQRAAEAIPQFEAALQIKPAADAHYDLALAYIEVGRPDAAAAQLRAAIALAPDLPEPHYQLAMLWEQAGKLVLAASEYEETLRLAPNHLGAHRRLGLRLASAGRWSPAAEHFRAIIRLQPNDADAYGNLANALFLQGQVQAAITCYEEALRLRPDDARTRENLELARAALR